MKTPITHRDQYKYFCDISTRWSDNDIFGHVNNVVYYAYFDTIVNRFLIEKAGLDIQAGEVIGVVAQSQCQYFNSIAYPDLVQGGLRVNKIGNSSVEYGLGVFGENEAEAKAQGSFTHVFVDRTNRRPIPIPNPMRTALQAILSMD